MSSLYRKIILGGIDYLFIEAIISIYSKKWLHQRTLNTSLKVIHVYLVLRKMVITLV